MKKIHWIIIFGMAVCTWGTSQSQVPWNWELSHGAEVLVEDVTLAHPFTGGMSATQWSMIDLDWDGDKDLFSFDRDGNRILVFENAGDGQWIEQPEWSQGWPELSNWVLLRDFDCDGMPDLFTGFQNGIHVWRNVSTGPGVPSFEPYAIPLMASWDFGAGAQMLPVVCLTIDKPAIFDVDLDGDLDFICFTETSTTLYRFSGQSTCELDLICTNRCYGMFSEGSEDNSLFIGDEHNCGFNVVDPEGRPAPEDSNPIEDFAARDGIHAGGAITALQLDGFDFHDLLISDVTYPSMSALFLEDAADGQDSTAWVDEAFPSLIAHAGPADSLMLQRFPAAFPIDHDADGDWDLVIAPNTGLEIDDDQCVQLWENQGTLDAPIWALNSERWIQDGTIDVGRGAIPHLADLDGDGDLDLLVGNKERYEGVNSTPTSLAGFENIGDAQMPLFELKSWSMIDFSINGIESAFPGTGDIDGDGDIDLIVGDELGLLHVYRNDSGPGNWPDWQMETLGLTDVSGEVIDVGQFATPQLIDVNEDGLLDLVIGEKNGTLSLYLRCSSAPDPSWCLYSDAEIGENWASIQVNNALGINGYSTPALYRDGSGVHVVVGNELGKAQYFGVIDPNDFGAALPEIDGQLNPTMMGLRAAAALGDINADGIPEMLVGIQNGGIRWLQGLSMHHSEIQSNHHPTAFPNPVVTNQMVQLRSSSIIEFVQWYDLNGRMIPLKFDQGNRVKAPATAGIYLMHWKVEDRLFSAKMVVLPQ